MERRPASNQSLPAWPNGSPITTLSSPRSRFDDMDRQPALTKLGFAVLGCNSVLAVYNSWGHPDSVAFVLGADAALALLFLCLCQFERDRGGAGARGRRVIKAAVWALTTLLTLMFASRVAPLMPPVVAAAVWTMAVATATAGFWAFFLN
ncbi:hypothetical protein SETIT_4G035500v2 [Setaria italica]|nr:hypothetical protein SETIT_4G035500v2 [Setaria italica]